MAKISINLLPVEFITAESKTANFYKVQAVGIAVILVMVFLASMMVALRILQSSSINQIKLRLSEEEQKVSNFKNKEASLVVLKNRLGVINQYLGVSSKQVEIYKLINQLLPSSIVLTSFSIDPSGGAVLVGIAQDSSSVDNFITSLLDKETSGGKINEVSVDSLNRGREAGYRISLKVKTN